jgi:dihydrofolate reductase
MKNKKIYIVVAVEKENGIGKYNKMPWHFCKEIKYFKKLTTETKDDSKINMVIMGRNTWESIPEKHRPLPARKNIILTRNKDYKAEDAIVANSMDEALEHAGDNIENIYIIGGGGLFAETIKDSRLDGVYITKIQKDYDCDVYFPEIPEEFSEQTELGVDNEDGVDFVYYLYERP